MDTKGKTLYGRMVERKCWLGPGPQETSTKKTRRIRLHRVSHTAHAETSVAPSQGSPARSGRRSFPRRTRTPQKYALRDWQVQWEGMRNSAARHWAHSPIQNRRLGINESIQGAENE